MEVEGGEATHQALPASSHVLGLISLTSGVAGTGGGEGPEKAGYGLPAHILHDIH